MLCHLTILCYDGLYNLSACGKKKKNKKCLLNMQNDERRKKELQCTDNVINLISHRITGVMWPYMLWLCVFKALPELDGSS